MPTSDHTPSILIASNSTSDAALIEQLIVREFGKVSISTNPEKSAADFVQQQPDILVLGFSNLEASERYYLGLYRLCADIHKKPHRTIVLCTKEEVQRAYTCCRDGLFDDYVLFWPITQDTPRLLMAVHHASFALNAKTRNGPTASDFAGPARRLAELKDVLEQKMLQGGEHIDKTGHAINQVEQEVHESLERFSEQCIQSELPKGNAAKAKNELDHLKKGYIQESFAKASDSVPPLKQWVDELKQECAPHLECAESLSAMAHQLSKLILVVDDDAFQRKVIGQILEAGKYRIALAASGEEAIKTLEKERPAVILMDFEMPGMNGIEVILQIKSIAKYSDIPIIMLTARSDKDVLNASAMAGVIDFIAKPCKRDMLIEKISKILGNL